MVQLAGQRNIPQLEAALTELWIADVAWELLGF